MTSPSSPGFNLNDVLQLGTLYLASTPLGSQLKSRGAKFKAESVIVRRHLLEAAKEIGALPPDSQAGISGAVQAILRHWQEVWTEGGEGSGPA